MPVMQATRRIPPRQPAGIFISLEHRFAGERLQQRAQHLAWIWLRELGEVFRSSTQAGQELWRRGARGLSAVQHGATMTSIVRNALGRCEEGRLGALEAALDCRWNCELSEREWNWMILPTFDSSCQQALVQAIGWSGAPAQLGDCHPVFAALQDIDSSKREHLQHVVLPKLQTALNGSAAGAQPGDLMLALEVLATESGVLFSPAPALSEQQQMLVANARPFWVPHRHFWDSYAQESVQQHLIEKVKGRFDSMTAQEQDQVFSPLLQAFRAAKMNNPGLATHYEEVRLDAARAVIEGALARPHFSITEGLERELQWLDKAGLGAGIPRISPWEQLVVDAKRMLARLQDDQPLPGDLLVAYQNMLEQLAHACSVGLTPEQAEQKLAQIRGEWAATFERCHMDSEDFVAVPPVKRRKVDEAGGSAIGSDCQLSASAARLIEVEAILDCIGRPEQIARHARRFQEALKAKLLTWGDLERSLQESILPKLLWTEEDHRRHLTDAGAKIWLALLDQQRPLAHSRFFSWLSAAQPEIWSQLLPAVREQIAAAHRQGALRVQRAEFYAQSAPETMKADELLPAFLDAKPPSDLVIKALQSIPVGEFATLLLQLPSHWLRSQDLVLAIIRSIAGGNEAARAKMDVLLAALPQALRSNGPFLRRLRDQGAESGTIDSVRWGCAIGQIVDDTLLTDPEFLSAWPDDHFSSVVLLTRVPRAAAADPQIAQLLARHGLIAQLPHAQLIQWGHLVPFDRLEVIPDEIFENPLAIEALIKPDAGDAYPFVRLTLDPRLTRAQMTTILHGMGELLPSFPRAEQGPDWEAISLADPIDVTGMDPWDQWILLACHSWPEGFLLANASQRRDPKFVLEAVKINPSVLYYVEQSIMTPEIVLAAVSKKGDMLREAPLTLRDDETIARAAVQQTSLAMRWVSDRLRDSEVFVRFAVEQDFQAFLQASTRLRYDRGVIELALQRDEHGWMCAAVWDEEMRRHPRFLELMDKHPSTEYGFWSDLQENTQQNRLIWDEVLMLNSELIRFAPNWLRQNFDVLFDSCGDGWTWGVAPELLTSPDFLKRAAADYVNLMAGGFDPEDIDFPSLLFSVEHITPLIRDEGEVYACLAREMREHPDVIAAALEAGVPIFQLPPREHTEQRLEELAMVEDPSWGNFLPMQCAVFVPEVYHDRAAALRLLQKARPGRQAPAGLSPTLRADPEIMAQCVELDGIHALDGADPALLANYDFMISQVRRDPSAMRWARLSLRADDRFLQTLLEMRAQERAALEQGTPADEKQKDRLATWDSCLKSSFCSDRFHDPEFWALLPRALVQASQDVIPSTIGSDARFAAVVFGHTGEPRSSSE
jgi:hypothetical protein